MELLEATKREYRKLIAPYQEQREKRGLKGKVKRRHRRFVWKQAQRMANTMLEKAPSPKKSTKTGGSRWKKENRAVYYKATGITPTGGVIIAEFAGGRGHASAAGFKFADRDKCRMAYLRDVVPTLKNPKAVVGALNQGYQGPLPEDMDDEAIEAAANKPGFFARIFNLRKLFG